MMPGMDDEDTTPRRTWLAAERTYLAWWRSGLAAAVSAIAVGHALPAAVGGSRWPYAMLGVGYGLPALGVFALGARRQRDIDTDLRGQPFRPVGQGPLMLMFGFGSALAVATLVVIVADA
jgi:putative membrane protein